MTTYTIKPIEWDVMERGLICRFGGIQIKNGIAYVTLNLPNCMMIDEMYGTLDEAKSFIETSYREFLEQFLEKI